MSRALFGKWAAGLTSGEFAQAIAAASLFGVFEQLDPALESVVKERLDAVSGILSTDALRVEDVAHATAGTQLAPASEYVRAWAAALTTMNDAGHWRARHMLEPRSRELSVHWVLAQLEHPDVRAGGVFLRVREPDRAVGWDWPIRIGILGTAPAPALRAMVEKCNWPHLVEIVDFTPGPFECDVLLIDADLRGSLGLALGQPRTLTGDVVIVLGDFGVPENRVQPLLRTLRTEIRTSGIVVAKLEHEARNHWFNELVRELSHDNPLDVSLWTAAEGMPSRPFIAATQELMQFARLAETVRRLSSHLRTLARPRGQRAAPPGSERVTAIADELEHVSRSHGYLSEGGGATVITKLREEAAAITGEPIRLVKKNGAPPPEAEPKKEDERRVAYDLYDQTEAAGRRVVGEPLVADHAYRLDISIGFPRDDGTSADGIFPAQDLPPSADGHHLTVAFCPLTRDSKGELAEPQTGNIFLPPQGPSDACTFHFDTFRLQERFDARVIVAYRNRVVQTLMFSGVLPTVKQPNGAPATLKVETIVDRDLNGLAYRSHVAASIVVNRTPAGMPAITTLAGKDIGFQELPQTQALREQITTLLGQIASREEPYDSLGHAELETLFWKLANLGRPVWSQLNPKNRELLASADVIQVVDARPGAYLPIEFFYTQPVPTQARKLCPRAAEFLRGKEAHTQCPNHADAAFECPLRFWGFDKVIERQAVFADDEGAGAFRLSTPAPHKASLGGLRSALIGASEKVRTQDLAEVRQAVTALVPGSLDAGDWDDWRTKVHEHSPVLLMLLPHSDEVKGLGVKIETLEIGGKALSINEFDPAVFTGPRSQAPIVFLLGCSTALTEMPFANFVSAFRQNGAALVIGTLGIIRGRRTVQFVEALLEALAGGSTSFGEAFLKVRRSLLATGDAFALTLVSYGDSDWTI